MTPHFYEVSRSHTTTHHSRQDSSERAISSSQRPLPDNTQQSQQTNIHAPRRAGDFYLPLKIRWLRPGLNPRTWVPKASTLPLDHRSRERGYLGTKNALRWHGAGGVLRCREIAQKIMLLVGLPLVCLINKLPVLFLNQQCTWCHKKI